MAVSKAGAKKKVIAKKKTIKKKTTKKNVIAKKTVEKKKATPKTVVVSKKKVAPKKKVGRKSKPLPGFSIFHGSIIDLKEDMITSSRRNGKFAGVSVGRDKDGFFAIKKTMRTKSYARALDIPDDEITSIADS